MLRLLIYSWLWLGRRGGTRKRVFHVAHLLRLISAFEPDTSRGYLTTAIRRA